MQKPFKQETRRLYLRELTPYDAAALYLLNLDKEVIRYTGDSPFPSTEAASIFLQNYNPYKLFGVGRWAVMRKSDGLFMGWCGLKYHPAEDMYDIGDDFMEGESAVFYTSKMDN